MKRRRKVAAFDSLVDYGPSVQTTRAGRLTSQGPGVVVFEDRADPDPTVKQLIRGARRWSVLDDLYREERIEKRQLDAANRFLDDLSRATGSLSGSWALLLAGRGHYEGISESQRRAMRSVEKVRLMLGLSPDTVFWWVVLNNQTPREFEDRHGLGHVGLALIWLRNALDALDEYYNGRSSSPRATIS